MAISRDLKINVTGKTAKFDKEVYLFQGDKNIDLNIEIIDSEYKYDRLTKGNVLMLIEGDIIATIKVLKPNGEQLSVKNVDVIDSKLVFTITSDIIDELEEIGVHKLQILLHSDDSSRHIPTVNFEVVAPIFIDDSNIELVEAIVDEVNAGECVVANDVRYAVRANGDYVATNWQTGDRITAAKLNKMEAKLKELDVSIVNKVGADYVDNEIAKIELIPGPQGNPGVDGKDGLPGNNGENGKSIEYIWRGTELGIRQECESNYTYVDLKGPKGDPGTGGEGGSGTPGQDGREIELQKGATYIEWRYVGETDWRNLIAISEITGPQGIQGEQGKQGIQGEPGRDGKDGVDGSVFDDTELKEKDADLEKRITVLSDTVNNHLSNHPSDTICKLVSPNGTEFLLKVGDDGSLYTESLDVELPSDFPTITIGGGSGVSNDFYVCPYGSPYIFILNNKGKVKWYKKLNKNFAYCFRRYVNSSGKNRYTYLQVINDEVPKVDMQTGYDNTELVILDENFNYFKNVRLKKHGIVEEGQPCENHDYIFIDDNHYILTSYHATVVDNVPDLSGRYKAINCVIQEIKNDEVVWHWNSIDHVEVYNASHAFNDFSNYGESQNTYNDYAHLNSIVIDERDGNILASFRHTGLMKIERGTGNILWFLGSKKNDISGVTSTHFNSLQHDARYNYDNSITVFDNSGGTQSNLRVCRYWIDEELKTLTKYKEYITSYDKVGAMGSARLVNDKYEIFDICYGNGSAKENTPTFSEINFSESSEVFSVKLNNLCYRVWRDINNDDIERPIVINVESITIDEKNIQMKIDEVKVLKYTILPSSSSNKNVIFNSSDESIVSVNNGILTAISPGSCVITVTTEDGAKTDNCNVTVSEGDVDGGEIVTSGLVNNFATKNILGSQTYLNDSIGTATFTLSGFTFDDNNGWTGTSVKLDDQTKVSTTVNLGLNEEYTVSVAIKVNAIPSNTAWFVNIDTWSNGVQFGYKNSIFLFEGSPFSKAIESNISTNDIITFDLVTNGSNQSYIYFNSKKIYTKENIFGINNKNVLFNDSDNERGNFEIISLRKYNRMLTDEEIIQNHNYNTSQ